MGKNLPPPTTMNAFSQFIESNSAKSKEMKKGEHLFFNRGSSFLYLETFLLFNCQFYVFLRHDKGNVKV